MKKVLICIALTSSLSSPSSFGEEGFDPVVFIENSAGYQGILKGGNLGGSYTGSGFVVDIEESLGELGKSRDACSHAERKGVYILSNEHVVRSANELYVTFLKKLPDGNISQETFKAEILGADERLDASLLFIGEDKYSERKLKREDFPSYPLGDSDPTVLKQGLRVNALGNPGGLKRSLSEGVVSSEKQNLSWVLFPVIQTDAALNPGNSGGPLILTSENRVIGINTYVRRGQQNIGFAIPINRVKEFVGQVLCEGEISHGTLFLDLEEVDEKIRSVLGFEEQRGEIISEVFDFLAMSDYSLEIKDIVMSVRDGEGDLINKAEGRGLPVGRGGDPLKALLFERRPGDEVTLNLLRSGEIIQTKVKLEKLDNPTMNLSKYLSFAGAFVQDLTDRERITYNYGGKGALVGNVIDGSDADQAELKRRDVIRHITYRTADDLKGFEIANLQDLREIADELETLIETSREKGDPLIIGFRGFNIYDRKPFYRFLRMGDFSGI